MECKSISKDPGYDSFYKELSELVTKDVKEQLNNYKPFIDDEINKLGLSLIEKIKSTPPSKEKFKVKLDRVISTDKINKCIKKRIFELFKITLVFEKSRYNYQNTDYFFMRHIFPEMYPFPENFQTYELEATWLPNNPFIYDLTPKVTALAVEAPKQFSYTHNPGNLGMRLWNNALKGSDTDVAFAVGNKMFTAHLCVLNAKSETPVFNVMFDKSKFREGETRCATIFDCQFEVFEAFLKFFYTDNIDSELSLEQVTELYSLAHQYTIGDLKDWALSVIEENISFVKDEIIFKSLLDMAYKYKLSDERISVILLSHLNKQNSDLVKEMNNISVLKMFVLIANKHNLKNAASFLKEQIVACIDLPNENL
jgi:hypothetical protein